MICPKCGKNIPNNVKFCKYCGSSINAAQNPNIHQNMLNSQKEAENKKKNIIIVTLIVIIIIASIACVFIATDVFKNDSNSNNGQSNPSKPISLSAFPISEAPGLAVAVQNSGYASSVSYGGVTFTKAQYLYVLSKSISEIAKGNSQGSLSVGSYSYCSNPSGRDHSQSISMSQYVDMCSRFSNWIGSKGAVPNYIGINSQGVPDVSPTNMARICCNILIQYKNSGQLPPSINI